MENDGKKYEDVIRTLKNLKEIKAPENFEADLQRRIYAEGVSASGGNEQAEKISKEEKKSFWQNILLPSRLIPSLGLVAIAVTIFFVVEANSEKMDNPFLIEPRVRTDVIEIKDYRQLKEEQQKELAKSKSLEKEKNIPEPKPDQSELKSSRDERTTGGKEENKAGNLLREQNLTKDKGKSEGNITIPDSLFAAITDSIQTAIPSEANSGLATGERATKEELNFRQVQLSPKEQKVVNELKTQVQSLEKVNKPQK